MRSKTAPSSHGHCRISLAKSVSTDFPFFFRALQNSVTDLQYQLESAVRIAPHEIDNPHVVVLTPGPLNETYFEHAYLANYLGYTLVQGDDLTVWDGRVWLKSLDGLRPVDIILRRVDDTFCDPLELRQDSRLGVAGLLEVIRQGNVVVINPPGSGVLENPGLMPFLPSIAKRLMDEDLRLSSVATWWCGQPKQREYVLANLEELVIKTIHRQPGERSMFGTQLSKAETRCTPQPDQCQSTPVRRTGTRSPFDNTFTD